MYLSASSKQISIAIIVLFFAGILGYFLFWFGYVEVFVNHAEVESFQIKSREKTYQCDKNPCRIKIRAGKKFVGQVKHNLAENKTFLIPKIPLLKTEKIVIQAKKELPQAEVEKISQDSLQKNWPHQIKNNFGPVLVSENNKFTIFSRYFAGKLKIFIKNQNSEQLLTTIEDEFLPIFLEKNFSLTKNGIVIPAKNWIYYYDFITQRKSQLLKVNSLRIADISVSADAKKVVFYNLKEKVWQKYSSGEIKNLDGENVAVFWGNKFLEVRGNIIYLNNEKWQKIPLEISVSDRFSIRGNNLIIEHNFEVLRIEL